jgi:hypothetical protein
VARQELGFTDDELRAATQLAIEASFVAGADQAAGRGPASSSEAAPGR